MASGNLDQREERDATVQDLYLRCHTQEEIAEAVGTSVGKVNEVCSEMATLPKMNKPDQAAAEHATDFTAPIYNLDALSSAIMSMKSASGNTAISSGGREPAPLRRRMATGTLSAPAASCASLRA